MDLFVEAAQELVARRGVAERTVRSRYSLTWTQEDGVVTETFDRGDLEDFRSLLMHFRLFTAPREHVYVPAVLDGIERRTANADVLRALAAIRKGWAQVWAGHVTLSLDGVTYTAEDCLDLWANGELFHTDRAKRDRLRAMPEEFRNHIEVTAIGAVVQGTRVVHAVASAIVQAREAGLLQAEPI